MTDPQPPSQPRSPYPWYCLGCDNWNAADVEWCGCGDGPPQPPPQRLREQDDKLFAANAILAMLRMGVCPSGFKREDLQEFAYRALRERAALAIARAWSINDVRQFLGWLSVEIVELHQVEIPRLDGALTRYLAARRQEEP